MQENNRYANLSESYSVSVLDVLSGNSSNGQSSTLKDSLPESVEVKATKMVQGQGAMRRSQTRCVTAAGL